MSVPKSFVAKYFDQVANVNEFAKLAKKELCPDTFWGVQPSKKAGDNKVRCAYHNEAKKREKKRDMKALQKKMTPPGEKVDVNAEVDILLQGITTKRFRGEAAGGCPPRR